MHAGIQLHPHGHRLGEIGLLQRRQLFGAMHRRMQALGGDHRQVFRSKKAFQQEDRLGDAPRSQAQRLFQAGDAKGVGVGQRSRGLEKTVSVGVRFHYRNQFAGRRQFTQTLQVVSQSAAVDNYSCRLHLNSLIKEGGRITHHHTEDRHNYRNATTGR